MKYYTQYVSRIKVRDRMFPGHKSQKHEVSKQGYELAKNKYPNAKEKKSKDHYLLLIDLGIFRV